AAQIARAKAEEERIKAEQVARVKAEEERIKAERTAKAIAEERERAKAAQIAKARAEAEEAAREKAKAEDTERAKAEQTAKARAEAIAKGEAQKHEFKVTTAAIDPAMTGTKVIAPDGRFEKLVSGVVRDTQNGLEWYAGPDKNMGWGDVKQWAAGLRVDGGGWRMPAIAELKSLYRKGAGSRNMTPLLETTGWRVWSVEAGAGPGGIAESTGWVLDFDDGREIQDRRDNSISKRGFAVRSMSESATTAISPAAAGVKIIASDSRFEKRASGVVRDTQNGLEWYAGPDKDTGWDDAKIWVAGLMIDGGGWRMPAIDELKSLYRKGSGSRNMTQLMEKTGWLVWTGKTAAIASIDTRSSALDFDDGTEVADRQGNSNFKRGFAVRSTFKPGTSEIDKQVSATKAVASDGRFEKRASGVVRDTQNGLEWYAGPDKNTNWDDAKQWAAGLSVDGGDWRMPAIRELKGLYRKGAGLRNMTPLLETTGWLIWSGETGGLGTVAGNSGWALDFDNGGELLERRDNSIYKRGFAVRSRK
ncbi:MAG: hypothetical protein QG578_652, partial [Thermodesulfobacteriota bacterium]|nr:hypothetical protein [Thermodesulfobacteriota bacterium]